MTTTAPAILEEVLGSIGCPFERDVPLGPLTWYGVGGQAEAVAHPRNAQDLSRLVFDCRAHGLRVRVLGKGANLLVCEGVVEGVVVRLDAIKHAQIDPGTGVVSVGGGADLEKLITATVRQGLEGLETLAGIPATVGGALRMNAGGAFGSIGPLVESVTAIGCGGRVAELGRGELEFGYRKSNLGERIVTEARLSLRPTTDLSALRQRLKSVMKYKKESQPMAASSAGCAFKNPPKSISDKGAGRLIDEAGLKGLRIGGAEVSHVHANFIVLHPGGKAADVLEVMDRVQAAVYEKFGIELEREVVVWRQGRE